VQTRLETQSERWKKWVGAKIAIGLCYRCGKNPVKKGRDYCAACTLRARHRRIKLYSNRLRKGLCPHCGGKREVPGIIGCQACNQKNDECRIRFSGRGDYRDKKALYQRRLLKRRRREGACPTCGRGVDDPEFILCSQCRQQASDSYYKHRERRLEHSHEHHRLNHQAKPLCPVCHHHRFHCSCGKMMKVYHGVESCLYTCTCGNIVTFALEALPTNKGGNR